VNHSPATGVPDAPGSRRLRWIALGAIVVALALVGAVVIYLSPVLALLEPHDPSLGRVAGAPAPTAPPLDSKQRINILLLGSDNDQKFQGNALLSQTMIVVSIDPSTHQVTMLSLPRDLWVEIPGHPSAKIDLAYAQGGAPLARATVERAFKIPIHYYAWVGLNGLVRVVDRVGGVDIDVLHPVLDDNYPNDFSGSGFGTERVELEVPARISRGPDRGHGALPARSPPGARAARPGHAVLRPCASGLLGRAGRARRLALAVQGAPLKSSPGPQRARARRAQTYARAWPNPQSTQIASLGGFLFLDPGFSRGLPICLIPTRPICLRPARPICPRPARPIFL